METLLGLIFVSVAIVVAAYLFIPLWLYNKKRWRELGRLFGRMRAIYSEARKGEISKPDVDKFFECVDKAIEMMSEKPFLNDQEDVPGLKEEIDKMSNQVSLLIATRAPKASQGEEIDKLAALRKDGLISDMEFKAFSERFMVSTSDKARGIIKAISDLSEQHKNGALMEGNYHAALWSLLDKLDRKIDRCIGLL